MTTNPRRAWLPWVSLALAIAAFVVDVVWGPAILAELLYIFPPLLGFLPAPQLRRPLLVGAKVTALSLIAMALRGDFAWVLLADRAVGLAAVWITVALCIVHHRDRLSILAEKAIGQSYLDIADVLIAVLDVDEKVILLNPKGCKILGVEPSAIVGSSGLDSLFTEEHREEAHRLLTGLARGRLTSRHLESTVLAKDGTPRIIDWHWAAPRDERGNALYLIGSGTDLTERRQAEASLLGQAALTRLGQMALMVAHEVKNPLAGIRGAVQVMGDRLSADPPVRQVVDRVLRSIDGLTKLVDDLLVFARPGLPTRGSMHVLALLRDVALLLEKDPKLDSSSVTIQGEDSQITGDPALLRQAFLNLILNAAEAGGPGSDVGVQVRTAGTGCSIEIHDEGPGIPSALRAKIFEPFYSTKARGSGLGLAIALRVVVLHGGDIRVQCPVAGGTTMTVTLP